MLSLSRHPSLNLPFPSAFRLVWDGVTLGNGATVIPILVVFTDHFGRIASELVDVPISQGSRGPEVTALIHGLLQKVLSQPENFFQISERSQGARRCKQQRPGVIAGCWPANGQPQRFAHVNCSRPSIFGEDRQQIR